MDGGSRFPSNRQSTSADEAIAQYDEVLARSPRHPPALLSRGTLFTQRGRYQETIADFDAVLASNPDDVHALTNRGNALAKLDRHLDALGCYDRVLAIDAANVDGLNNRGATLKRSAVRATRWPATSGRWASNPRHVG